MQNESVSGIIGLEDDCVLYRLSNRAWELPVPAIKVIGEHTNDDGPFVDDYFLVFFTEAHVYEASFYAEGREDFLNQLSARLGATLACELGNSTTYMSRVMWPPDLEGLRIFDYSTRLKTQGAWAKLKYKLFPEVSRSLSDVVRQRLKLT